MILRTISRSSADFREMETILLIVMWLVAAGIFAAGAVWPADRKGLSVAQEIITEGQVEASVMPAAWVRYQVGRMPNFVPVVNGSVTFHCSAIEALEYKPLYAMPENATFEVCDADGIVQAETRGPREQALRDAEHYAFMYGQDGPVQVFEVLRVPAMNNT